jgi:hypothetical protein
MTNYFILNNFSDKRIFQSCRFGKIQMRFPNSAWHAIWFPGDGIKKGNRSPRLIIHPFAKELFPFIFMKAVAEPGMMFAHLDLAARGPGPDKI